MILALVPIVKLLFESTNKPPDKLSVPFTVAFPVNVLFPEPLSVKLL